MDSFEKARSAMRDAQRALRESLQKLARVLYLRKPTSKLSGEVAFLDGAHRPESPFVQLFVAWAEDQDSGEVRDLAREAQATLATADRLDDWRTTARDMQAVLDTGRMLKDLTARVTALSETIQVPARVAFRVGRARCEVADVSRRGKTFLEVRPCRADGSPDPAASLQRFLWKLGSWRCGEACVKVWNERGETFDGPRR